MEQKTVFIGATGYDHYCTEGRKKLLDAGCCLIENQLGRPYTAFGQRFQGNAQYLCQFIYRFGRAFFQLRFSAANTVQRGVRNARLDR